jgi:hypothetical protein
MTEAFPNCHQTFLGLEGMLVGHVVVIQGLHQLLLL